MRHRLAIAAGVLAWSARAEASPRWDVEALLGSEVRGGGRASFGPTLDASGHVAVYPLVRAGLYVHHDAVGDDEEGAREFTSGGLDLRLLAPWSTGPVRLYVRAGIGEGVGAVAPRSAAFVYHAAASGRFTEVPLALGLLSRVAPQLWVSVEAGARLGFGFGGREFAPGSGVGDDVASGYLDLGVAWGR